MYTTQMSQVKFSSLTIAKHACLVVPMLMVCIITLLMQGCEDWIQAIEREGERMQQERCIVFGQQFWKNEQVGAC